MAEEQAVEELDRIYIKQIDYKQDLKSFIVSKDIENDLKYLTNLIGLYLKPTTSHDYKQLMNCY